MGRMLHEKVGLCIVWDVLHVANCQAQFVWMGRMLHEKVGLCSIV